MNKATYALLWGVCIGMVYVLAYTTPRDGDA